jgi:hypothetical protein
MRMTEGSKPAETPFKLGDRVLMRPEFVHLYPAQVGVIMNVKLDSFRSTFNEYTVEFPGRIRRSAFEFQILRDNSANK